MPPAADPTWWQRAIGAVKGVASSGLGLVKGAYDVLKSAISTSWGYFQSVIGSVAGFLAGIPGWAFLVVPLAAAAVYLYYHRYAQRPESLAERKAGAMRPKVLAIRDYVQQLGQALSAPEFQSMTDMLQAALPALGRYFDRLNTFDSILNFTLPDSEPANAAEMLAELLTIQTNLEALVQKVRQIVSPQSAAIAQANTPLPFSSPNTATTPSLPYGVNVQQPFQHSFQQPFQQSFQQPFQQPYYGLGVTPIPPPIGMTFG